LDGFHRCPARLTPGPIGGGDLSGASMGFSRTLSIAGAAPLAAVHPWRLAAGRIECEDLCPLPGKTGFLVSAHLRRQRSGSSARPLVDASPISAVPVAIRDGSGWVRVSVAARLDASNRVPARGADRGGRRWLLGRVALGAVPTVRAVSVQATLGSGSRPPTLGCSSG
jgi:hypothetical protein